MGTFGNSWRIKREEQHDNHNRKPGRGKYWKRLNNRKGRRGRTRQNREIRENSHV